METAHYQMEYFSQHHVSSVLNSDFVGEPVFVV